MATNADDPRPMAQKVAMVTAAADEAAALVRRVRDLDEIAGDLADVRDRYDLRELAVTETDDGSNWNVLTRINPKREKKVEKEKPPGAVTKPKPVQNKKEKAKKEKAKKEKAENVQPRKTRAMTRPQADLNKPVLDFTSGYTGVRTQKLYEQQNINFTQTATLRNPANAALMAASNYHFWQEVQDVFVHVDANHGPENQPEHRRNWEWDRPYGPPYRDAVITSAQNAIAFQDDPGWSTTSKLGSGYWLTSYSVSFRWKVARNAGAWDMNAVANVWTSPIVTHTVTCDLDVENPDAPVRVNARAAGVKHWDIAIPGPS